MMFDRDFSFFNSPRYESYEPFGFGPRYGPRLVRDDPFWNPQQRRRVPRPEYRTGKECQCGHCDLDTNRLLGPQKGRFGERDIPVTVTKNIPKDSKSRDSGQTKQKPSPETVRRPKLNRQKNQGEKQKKQKSEKAVINTDGGKEQKERPRKQNVPTARSTKLNGCARSNVGDKLNVGDRSNLTKEEPILVQLSTPEIKHIDFDPFQADEEIEIPPCL